ncbi:MAG TPA: pseudouridine synthase [Capsulimonadaceae bacterium]|jgi:23S rRNA pseudouridine2605 synthase
MAERLQKLIAAAGLASRRASEEWIKEGRVAVDGVTAQLGDQADPKTQKITIDGRLLPPVPTRNCYIVLHKPRGFASTLSDPHAAHVITELVDLPGRVLLRPVGRLDIESEGLIFLSDDGDFINRITHPRYHVSKTYLATVRGVPDAEDLDRLRTGVYLDDGKTAPADNVALAGTFPATDSSDVELVLHEGRNRQVRRMMQAIGHPVLRLVRTRIGPIAIKGLPSGAWRHLTPTEVARITADGNETAAGGKPKLPPTKAMRAQRAPQVEKPRNTHTPRRGSVRHIDTEERKRMDGLGPPQRRPKPKPGEDKTGKPNPADRRPGAGKNIDRRRLDNG